MQKIKNWDKIQIPREMRLKHYDVYYEGHGVGCYAENYQKTYLGDIWEVSEAMACNRMRYRFRDKKHPNGGYSGDVCRGIRKSAGKINNIKLHWEYIKEE